MPVKVYFFHAYHENGCTNKNCVHKHIRDLHAIRIAISNPRFKTSPCNNSNCNYLICNHLHPYDLDILTDNKSRWSAIKKKKDFSTPQINHVVFPVKKSSWSSITTNNINNIINNNSFSSENLPSWASIVKAHHNHSQSHSLTFKITKTKRKWLGEWADYSDNDIDWSINPFS